MLRPRRDYLLVEPLPLPTEQVTKSGIVVPQTNYTVPPVVRAEVIAVGPGYRRDDGSYSKLDIQLGDVVVYNINAGTKVKDAGIDYVLLQEHQIMAEQVE